LGRTFFDNPNERFVRLQNSTSLPVRYQLLYPRSGRLHFRSDQSEGVIDANTIRDVPLTITVKQLGDITEKVEVHRVGARDAPLELQVAATGTGPVLFIDPGEIRFGTISVLEEHAQILSLSNESPIPAVFRFEPDKKNSCFSCQPSSGVVEPHTSIDIRVIAKLNDRLKFNEELIIHVDHSTPRGIPITAQGTGALIVPDVPIHPSLNLGSRFVGTSIIQRLHFTNKGRRQLAVHFIPAGDTAAAYGVQRKIKAASKESDLNKTSDQTFRLEPERLEFAPGETRLLTVTGLAAQPKTVDEAFTCLAIIGRSTGRDKLFSLKIHCEFVEPLMSFSKTDLYFRVEYNEQTMLDGLRTPISSELTFSNISAIDLTANLRVKHPFLLKNDPNDDFRSNSRLDSIDEVSADIPQGYTCNKKMKILTGMSYAEQVYFDPSANTKELSWKCDEQLVFTYEEHAFNVSSRWLFICFKFIVLEYDQSTW
jgi:hydrocephalus-inducing protein